MTSKGGLLEALMRSKSKIGRNIQMPASATRPGQREQTGGADSYAWHRDKTNGIANAYSHLDAVKRLPWEREAKSGQTKRAIWVEEVRALAASEGLSWKDALKTASERRKANNQEYQTVVERVKNSYTGRREEAVTCKTDRCPGKYTKEVARDQNGEIIYRPQGHNASRKHLSATAATNVLRDYYRRHADQYKNGLAGATKAMRQDISRLNKSRVVQSPCPTKLSNVTNKKGTTFTRRVVDKAHPDFKECRSNWLYRDNPKKFDMEGIDAKTGKDSPAYPKLTVPKVRKQRVPGDRAPAQA
jgi:hypothetical protein